MKRIVVFVLLAFVLCLKMPSQIEYDKSFYLIDIKPDFEFIPTDKHDVDSILRLYHATKNDTLRLYYLRLFSEGLTNEYLWTRYNKYLYTYSSAKNDSLYQFYYACAINNLGYESQYVKNDLEKAKKYYHQSYEIFKKIKNGSGLGVEINNLAYIYQHEGNIEKAVELYTEAGSYFQKLNQPLGLTSVYINLGDIYFKNDDFDKAEDFFNKALAFAIKTEQKGVIANVYNQLGVIYSNKNNVVSAIDYFQKASTFYEKDHNYNKLALISIGLANAYNKQHDSLLFEKFVLKALDNALLSSDMQVKAEVYDYVALLYIFKKDYKKGLRFADSSYFFAKQLAYPELIAKAAQKLSNIYKYQGHYDLAFKFLNETKAIQDSLSNVATQKSIIKSQYQLEYNKKEVELKADQDKKDAVRLSEKRQQQIILFIVSIALLVIAIFAFIAFRNFIQTKKAKKVIEEQKNQVEVQKEEISIQKELVEEKQKEIIDSINYAKRIQSAVLTGEEVWNKVSKEHFILFKPKDIVSGDFYWAYNTPNNRSIFVLADCTGHGVPGGFMSMLGNSFLNELIVDSKLFKANEILNKLRDKIITALKQEGNSEQKDGMDMCLCVWNKLDNTLEFAGANNPLWILRDKELTEYKANKMPIGAYVENPVPFTSQTIQLQKGDIIYMITDGYADQFGGPKGKKFKYKPLQDILKDNSDKLMQEQKVALEIALNQWKENYEQVDDISLIGVRV